MTLKFCSFASGSSGNCYLVKNDDTAILIDAGISGKKIFEGLEVTGTPRDMVCAVLVTHEHTDHIRSLHTIAKKLPGAHVYANAGTWDSMRQHISEAQREYFRTGEDFSVGGFAVRPFPISHDAADPVGFSISCGDKQISICTDSGCVSDDIYEEISGADLLLLEANHEKEMLLFGKYPYSLKKRILGDRGHLSNVTCGECLCRIVEKNPKNRVVLLGHMSRENNTPEVAMQAVKNTLEEQNIFIGGDLRIDVILRDCMSGVYEL